MADARDGSQTAEGELFDAAFMDTLRRAFLRLRRRRALQRHGPQQSPVQGGSREFRDRRPYVEGDDFRSIDWRVYARLDKLFIRLVEDQQEYHVHLLIDTSASMARPYPAKRVMQLRSAAALAYLALVNQHRVSVYGMCEGVERLLPPRKGQGHLRELLQALAGLPYAGLGDPARALSTFTPGRGGRGLLIVCSDLLGRDPAALVESLPRLGSLPVQVHLLQTLAPEERDPGAQGSLLLEDVESGDTRRVQLGEREAAAYRHRFEGWLEEIAAICRSRRLEHMLLPTERPFEDLIIELLESGQALAGH